MKKDFVEELQGRLSEGEKVLWSGSPTKASGRGIVGFFVGVFMLAGSIAVILMGLGVKVPILPRLKWDEDVLGSLVVFGVIFAIVGIVLLFSPKMQGDEAKRSFYAVTSNRVIFLYRYSDHDLTLKDLPFDKIGKLKVTTKNDGSGNLAIEQSNPSGIKESVLKSFLFINIPDVQSVYDIIDTRIK